MGNTMSTEGEPDVSKKSIYVGNLGSNVTSEDLTNLFGLGATPFLQKTCCVDVACDDKTGKSKNFAIVTVPEHVHSELIKLNGIEFYGRQIVIEEEVVVITVVAAVVEVVLGVVDRSVNSTFQLWNRIRFSIWSIVESTLLTLSSISIPTMLSP